MGSIGGTAALLESASEAFSNFTRGAWLTITVVELNGLVAGWAAREALDENISDFWIDPDHLRRGLGSALLAQIEKDVLGQGLEKVAVQTPRRQHRCDREFLQGAWLCHPLALR